MTTALTSLPPPRSLTNPPEQITDLLVDVADTFGRVSPMLPVEHAISLTTHCYFVDPLHVEWRQMLMATATGDSADYLTGRLVDVREAWRNVQQREASGGHDHTSCCDGECGCVDRAICDDCREKPHALLHDAVRELLILIGRTCGESRVVATYGLVS